MGDVLRVRAGTPLVPARLSPQRAPLCPRGGEVPPPALLWALLGVELQLTSVPN